MSGSHEVARRSHGRTQYDPDLNPHPDPGILCYSTCTLSAEENEGVVAYALRGCPVRLRLVLPPERLRLGGAGWAGCGLHDDERVLVQRFDPSDEHSGGANSIGFFIAQLQRVA